MTTLEGVRVVDADGRVWWVLHTGKAMRPIAMIDDRNMSNLFRSMLRQNRAAGVPIEDFNGPGESAHAFPSRADAG